MSSTSAVPGDAVPNEGQAQRTWRNKLQQTLVEVSWTTGHKLRRLVDIIQGPAAMGRSTAWLMGCQYGSRDGHALTDEDLQLLLADFRSHIWCTYRRDFIALGPDALTSDVGWGCTIRSGQMMLAEAVLRHVLGRAWRQEYWGSGNSARSQEQLMQVLSTLLDHPHACLSIHRICAAGQAHGIVPGRWLGPWVLCKALASLVNNSPQLGLALHVVCDPGGGAPSVNLQQLLALMQPGAADAATAQPAMGAEPCASGADVEAPALQGNCERHACDAPKHGAEQVCSQQVHTQGQHLLPQGQDVDQQQQQQGQHQQEQPQHQQQQQQGIYDGHCDTSTPTPSDTSTPTPADTEAALDKEGPQQQAPAAGTHGCPPGSALIQLLEPAGQVDADDHGSMRPLPGQHCQQLPCSCQPGSQQANCASEQDKASCGMLSMPQSPAVPTTRPQQGCSWAPDSPAPRATLAQDDMATGPSSYAGWSGREPSWEPVAQPANDVIADDMAGDSSSQVSGSPWAAAGPGPPEAEQQQPVWHSPEPGEGDLDTDVDGDAEAAGTALDAHAAALTDMAFQAAEAPADTQTLTAAALPSGHVPGPAHPDHLATAAAAAGAAAAAAAPTAEASATAGAPSTAGAAAGLVLLLPLTLGVGKANPVYHAQLQRVLTFPQSIGILGGRPSASLYFVGWQAQQLLYLDPHVPQQAGLCPATYFCDTVRLLPISSIDPSLAIGFYCRTPADVVDLVQRLEALAAEHCKAPIVTVEAAGAGPRLLGLYGQQAGIRSADDTEESWELL